MRGPLVSSNRKFGWFAWFSGYEWSRDNSKEIEKGWIVKGETVAELAAKLGMKPADLEATIARYNENCKKQVDPDFDRPKESLVAIEKPPYYAVKLFPTMVNTQGGPKRNAKCQVVDPYDQPIPRLYTRGRTGLILGMDVQRRWKQRGVPLHGANRRAQRRRHEAARVDWQRPGAQPVGCQVFRFRKL